jgi:hypothetical protein
MENGMGKKKVQINFTFSELCYHEIEIPIGRYKAREKFKALHS